MVEFANMMVNGDILTFTQVSFVYLTDKRKLNGKRRKILNQEVNAVYYGRKKTGPSPSEVYMLFGVFNVSLFTRCR